MSQIEMVCLADLVPSTHSYRRFREYLPQSLISNHLKGIERVNTGRMGCKRVRINTGMAIKGM